MGWAYLAGLLTLPVLGGAWLAALLVVARVGAALDRRGWWVNVHIRTPQGSPGDYALRSHIWTEHQVGPIFFGHWARDEHFWDHEKDAADSRFAVSRWVGIGRGRGRGVAFGRKVYR